MASNKPTGYDLDWVEDPPDGLKCLICKLVARDPQQNPGDENNECGKIFCLDCITEYQKKNTNCPHCRQKLSLFRDERSAIDIKALKVKCQNQGNGCNWTGELESLNTHLESCPFTLLPCTYECTNKDKEITKILRKNLKHHLNTECTRRPHTCLHCKEEGEHWKMTKSHLETCPKVEVECEKFHCKKKVARDKLSTHRTVCQYEPVSCKYAAVGCKKKPLRKELKNHEKDDQLHFQITTKKVLELTERVTSAEEELKKVNFHVLKLTSLTPCILKLTNYEQHKEKNEPFYNPSFYTSYRGYKMCLIVYANGDSQGKGSYVSVGASLKKGEHDDTLTWPFNGTIIIELLNQLEDKNHHKRIVTFSADHEASNRVMDDKEVEEKRKWGLSQFISHAALNYDASTNTQYLKDDTLVFRVSVKVPNHRPWLDCIPATHTVIASETL